MDDDWKKLLKIDVTEFYKLNLKLLKIITGSWKWKFMRNLSTVCKEKLIRRVKIKQKEIDQNVKIKMFENLEEKVHKANESGLDSLIKI